MKERLTLLTKKGGTYLAEEREETTYLVTTQEKTLTSDSEERKTYLSEARGSTHLDTTHERPLTLLATYLSPAPRRERRREK